MSRVYAGLGYTPEAVAERIDDIFAIMHPDDKEPTRKAVEDHLAGVSDRYYCEFRLHDSSGSWVWFANYGKIVDRNVGDSGGRYFTGVSFNIEEKRRQQAQMRALNKQLAEKNALLESMSVAS